MRVADYIFRYLSDKGTDTVFMVSGGQAMFLVDAVYQNKSLTTICTHHEQSAGMAAEAYGRITGKVGVALVTAGPGGVNIMNGVVGGWTDSAPMIIISGQSALSAVRYQKNSHIRQYGIQGIYIQPLVESVVKYFMTVDDPAKIKAYMDEAYRLALTGRPGPVWIDVPLDIQSMEVPEQFDEMTARVDNGRDAGTLLKQVDSVVELLKKAKRPLFLVGQGIRCAHSEEVFLKYIEQHNIPTLTSRLGIDIIESAHRLYVGRPGNYGERAANFAVQNADLVISVGCRLASALVGHAPKDFGRNAKKVVVDIDHEELVKPGVFIDVPIQADALLFLQELAARTPKLANDLEPWVKTCQGWKERYPVVLPEYKESRPVNSYYFTERLSAKADAGDVILVDTGSCFHVACQTWKIKKGQRFLTTGGISSMGYWVAGIGACMANGRQNTIVITGDGSLQMNLQELATIKHNNLPIKVIIFNNNGYLLIRHTQKNFMDGRLFGEGPDSGVWCPDSLAIAQAYGIKGVRISSPDEIDAKIDEVLKHDGPVVCDVMTPEWQLLIPRVTSEKLPDGKLISKPYEDMYPFLDRDVFKKEMAV